MAIIGVWGGGEAKTGYQVLEFRSKYQSQEPH